MGVPKSQCHYSVIYLYSAYNVSQLQRNYSVTSLPSAAARDAAAVALRGSERGMAKMERSGN